MLGRNTLAGLDGRAFTALLHEDDRKRGEVLSSLLSSLARPDVRIIRMGSPSRPHALLESILAPVIGPDGEAFLPENARLITRTIAARRGQETRVVLLIKQAEKLHPKMLRALQAMTRYFAQSGEPTLQVAFVGRPAFRALLDGKDLAPLREALELEPDLPTPELELTRPSSRVRPLGTAAPTLDEPEAAHMAPLSETIMDGGARRATPMLPEAAPRRGRVLIRILGGIALLAMLFSLGALGLHKLFYRDVPANPARRPAAATVPPPPALPGNLSPPAAEVPADKEAEIRQSFDDFLASTGRSGAAPSETQRPVPSVQRPDPRPEPRPEPRPDSRPDPRIVIHVPAGSTSAEALSARLVSGFRARPGTVETRRVADTPSRPSIRYFHPEDEPTARLAAAGMAATGLNWTLQDFSTFQPRPSRGTIEVWLPRQP